MTNERAKVAKGKAAKAAKAATPWGQATVVDEVAVPQRAGDKRFTTVVQLLEIDGGDSLLRFAYSTGGNARRGPVTLRRRDVDRLRAASAGRGQLADALRALGVSDDGRLDRAGRRDQ